ncbi:MarR family winged helix-turn-helix transcriptional regulator [Streptomyces sp. NPDC096311]|uniref:MarR family winged helix-turn-helix transcriptional regulator n=1 Tax=Streptomyces sp. NPDC096311 TaxID=3366083 RepID=UPI003815CDC9
MVDAEKQIPLRARISDNMLSLWKYVVMLTRDQHPLSAIVDEILRTRGRLLSATAEFGAEEGLTGAQGLVLTVVAQSAKSSTVPQIGRSLGYTRQAVQRTADSLVESGLIEFVDNPDHKRARLLVLTERGVSVHAAVERRGRAWQARIAEGIDPAALASAAETLRELRTRLEADDSGSALS